MDRHEMEQMYKVLAEMPERTPEENEEMLALFHELWPEFWKGRSRPVRDFPQLDKEEQKSE